MPRWTKRKPAKEGLYLCSNPPIGQATRRRVHAVNSELLVTWGPSNAGLLKVAELPDGFWWYGPIPDPPWKQISTVATESKP